MGESREGEGSDRQITTTDVARTLLHEYNDQGVVVDDLQIQYVTEGLYAVDLRERGANTRERYLVRFDPSR